MQQNAGFSLMSTQRPKGQVEHDTWCKVKFPLCFCNLRMPTANCFCGIFPSCSPCGLSEWDWQLSANKCWIVLEMYYGLMHKTANKLGRLYIANLPHLKIYSSFILDWVQTQICIYMPFSSHPSSSAAEIIDFWQRFGSTGAGRPLMPYPRG